MRAPRPPPAARGRRTASRVGPRVPRVEIQHSRLRTKRSASCAASITSGAKSGAVPRAASARRRRGRASCRRRARASARDATWRARHRPARLIGEPRGPRPGARASPRAAPTADAARSSHGGRPAPAGGSRPPVRHRGSPRVALDSRPGRPDLVAEPCAAISSTTFATISRLEPSTCGTTAISPIIAPSPFSALRADPPGEPQSPGTATSRTTAHSAVGTLLQSAPPGPLRHRGSRPDRLRDFRRAPRVGLRSTVTWASSSTSTRTT